MLPCGGAFQFPPTRNTTFADIIEEDEPKGVRWHTQAETDRLLGMIIPVHLERIETAKRAGRRMVGGLYRRTRPDANGKKGQRAEVRFDDVAGCLRVPKGGFKFRQTILIVEGASVRSRLLSPREAARLMGLPDDYQLPSNYNDAYGLMGDGVAVALWSNSWRSTSSSPSYERKEIWRISPSQSRRSDADDQRRENL